MKLYTSYYARENNNPKAISISVVAPKYFLGLRYTPLAPTWDIIRQHNSGTITDEQYTERYYDLITKERKLNAYKIVEELGDGTIMLCYEVPSDFCHRHIVAKWIEQETGILVQELQIEAPVNLVNDVLEF